MKIRMIGTAFVASLLATAANAQVPRYDVQASCRAATQSLHQSLGSESKLTMEERAARCVKTEENAKDKLMTVWSQFDEAERASCIGSSSSGGGGGGGESQSAFNVMQASRNH